MSEPDERHRRKRPVPSRELAKRAGRALEGSRTPLHRIGVRGDEDGPDDVHVRQVMDLALRMGEAMLGTGAPASDVTADVLRLARAYGVRSVQADVTYVSITVSYHRGALRDPVTVMRIVPTLQADFTRLESLHELLRDIIAGSVGIDPARERLDEIVARPHPYSRLTVTAALALLGAAVAALLGGGWVLITLSAITAAIVDRVQRALWRLRVPAFFSQAVGAAIPTSVAVALNQLAHHTDSQSIDALRPSVVVASGVVALLAGLSVVSAAQDTIDGFYLTAAARTFEVTILSGGVVAGVVGTLAIAKRAGVPISVTTHITYSTNQVVSTLAAAAVSIAFGIASYAGRRTLLVAAAAGAAGWAVYEVCLALSVSPPVGAAFAALVIGVVGQTAGWRLHVPSLAVTTAGIVSLLPGLAVYRGVFQLVQRPDMPTTGGATLFGAMLVGLAIASGVTLGSLPQRLARADRTQRRVQRRSLPGTRD